MTCNPILGEHFASNCIKIRLNSIFCLVGCRTWLASLRGTRHGNHPRHQRYGKKTLTPTIASPGRNDTDQSAGHSNPSH